MNESTAQSKQTAAEWLEQVAPTQSASSIASLIGVPQRTLARHISDDSLRPEHVIRICRALGYPPADGLVETGYLTVSEATPQLPDTRGEHGPATLAKATEDLLFLAGKLTELADMRHDSTTALAKIRALIGSCVPRETAEVELAAATTEELSAELHRRLTKSRTQLLNEGLNI